MSLEHHKTARRMPPKLQLVASYSRSTTPPHPFFTMPVSISIEPLAPSIDMYDSPDTSSAYSLSGHIAITVTPSSSILGLSRPSPQNLLLSSLELTFEGQSELVLNDAGYSPLRIITITKQLVSPSQAIHISVDEDSAEWRVVFNLAVPGWLPATSAFGDDDEHNAAGVNYALYARARFISASPDLDDAASSAASTSTQSVWNNLCSVVRLGSTRPRAVHAEKVPIRLTRFVSPPPRACDVEDASLHTFPRAVFAIQTLPASAPGEGPVTNIPADILRSVQFHAIVPTRTSVDETGVPLTLRLRSRSDNPDERNRLKVLGFEAEVFQVEQYHTSPTASYAARYPLPPAAQQPPNKALKSTHPVGTLFDLGLVGAAIHGQHVTRQRSIVPEGESKLFKVRPSGSSDEGVRFEEGWVRMEVNVPVSPGLEDRGGGGKRVAGESPLFDVRHEMRVRLTVGYEQPGEDSTTLSDELGFSVPLEFVLVAPTTVSPLASTFFPVLAHMHGRSTSSLPLPQPPMNASARAPSRARSLSSLCTDGSSRPSSPFPPPPPLPTPPPLPAYSQLFHENGDRKDDLHSVLPLYREKEESPISGTDAPSASSSSAPSPTSPSTLISNRVPQLENVSALPESPISPGMPLTPPGLVECLAPKKSKSRRRHKFGESFLRFDGDDSEFEPRETVPGRQEGLAIGDEEDVQYGIAY